MCGTECPLIGCNAPTVLEACVSACAVGVVESITKEVQAIIDHAATQNNQTTKYFMIPTQPDISLTPRYQGTFFSNTSKLSQAFAHSVVVAHNKYFMNAMQKLKDLILESKF